MAVSSNHSLVTKYSSCHCMWECWVYYEKNGFEKNPSSLGPTQCFENVFSSLALARSTDSWHRFLFVVICCHLTNSVRCIFWMLWFIVVVTWHHFPSSAAVTQVKHGQLLRPSPRRSSLFLVDCRELLLMNLSLIVSVLACDLLFVSAACGRHRWM